MDDGVILRVNVKYPIERVGRTPARGPFPSLLTQTPYGKDSPLDAFCLGGGTDDYLVRRGYIAVIADVRGRGASQGAFDFWGSQERRDGVTLARWAAALPDSNGRVGLFGGSYMGITQLLTASVAGPNSPIKAAVPEALNVGEVTRFEIGVWPTAFQVEAGERLRITLSTSDIPFAMPSVPTIVNLAGGVYEIERNAIHASAVTIPIADPENFPRDCIICRVH